MVYFACFASNFFSVTVTNFFLRQPVFIFYFLFRRLNFKFINVFLLVFLGDGHYRLNLIVGLFQVNEYIIRFLDKIPDSISSCIQFLIGI